MLWSGSQGEIVAYDPHVSDGKLLCIYNQLSFFSPSAEIIGSELGTDQTGPIRDWPAGRPTKYRGECGGLQPSLYHHRDSSSMLTSPPRHTIFEGGKLKPGFYKIQNLVSKTYVDIHEHTMGVCCRPASTLEKDDGIVCTPRFPAFSLANPAFAVGSPVVRRWVYNSHGSRTFRRFMCSLTTYTTT